MKLLLVVDGETELGDAELMGTAEHYVRRILDLPSRGVVLRTVKNGTLPKHPGRRFERAHGDDAAVRRAWEYARALGCGGLVLLRDAEGRPDDRRAALEAGRASLDTGDAAVVLGVQIQCVEAWLLADREAFRKAFGGEPVTYGSPETLWGKPNDRDSNHPKQTYRRVLEGLGRRPSRRTNAVLMEQQDVEVMRSAAPAGFGRFAADLERAFPAFDVVVAALDGSRGIGINGDLPWGNRTLKADLRHFKSTTSRAPEGMRNAVIMGRKTWDTFPRPEPLPGRLNIVLARSTQPVIPASMRCASSLDEALGIARADPTVHDIFVIGGGQIYEEAMLHPRCRTLYFTRVRSAAPIDTDAHFPSFEADWERTEVLAQHEDGGFDYQIETWRRRRP